LQFKTNAIQVLSGSTGLKIDAGESVAKLQLMDVGAAGSVSLDVPTAVGGNITLTLPASNGTAGHFMQTDGAGNLSFASAAAGTVKAVRVMTGAIAPGIKVELKTSEITAGTEITGMGTASTQGKTLDVFVNGQLLVSGSQSERQAGDRDYEIVSGQVLKFAFALENDDVVQVIKR